MTTKLFLLVKVYLGTLVLHPFPSVTAMPWSGLDEWLQGFWEILLLSLHHSMALLCPASDLATEFKADFKDVLISLLFVYYEDVYNNWI